jgi:hypothetical protein
MSTRNKKTPRRQSKVVAENWGVFVGVEVEQYIVVKYVCEYLCI